MRLFAAFVLFMTLSACGNLPYPNCYFETLSVCVDMDNMYYTSQTQMSKAIETITERYLIETNNNRNVNDVSYFFLMHNVAIMADNDRVNQTVNAQAVTQFDNDKDTIQIVLKDSYPNNWYDASYHLTHEFLHVFLFMETKDFGFNHPSYVFDENDPNSLLMKIWYFVEKVN